MVLPLGTKVCGTASRKHSTLLDSPLLKNRNRKISSSLLMEGCGVFAHKFQQFYLVKMLKLFLVPQKNDCFCLACGVLGEIRNYEFCSISVRQKNVRLEMES